MRIRRWIFCRTCHWIIPISACTTKATSSCVAGRVLGKKRWSITCIACKRCLHKKESKLGSIFGGMMSITIGRGGNGRSCTFFRFLSEGCTRTIESCTIFKRDPLSTDQKRPERGIRPDPKLAFEQEVCFSLSGFFPYKKVHIRIWHVCPFSSCSFTTNKSSEGSAAFVQHYHSLKRKGKLIMKN